MGKKTILIVDDEERNIRLLKAILSLENYGVSGVLSGDEALNLVAEMDPDLILLDVMMPGIDGIEVCRRLKQDEKTRMIPVVMVTALNEKEYYIKAMEAGADDFRNKPVDQTELLIRVKSLLRIKSYHDELLISYKEIAEKNKKLRELEKIKQGLMHMIIHDLNNPLTAISGNLEILLMDIEGTSERQHKRIEKCYAYCKDLNLLIQSILDIHKMEEATLVLEKEETSMHVLLDEVLPQFTQKTASKHISLSFQISKDLPSVNIDQKLIKRVIANLLNNAIRNTPEGGHIKGTIDLLPEKGGLFLSVTDNGNGLEPENHQRIFDKFEQVKLKQAGVSSGSSGLGLAFCKMAVEAHEGKIWVESEGKDKGSTFCFMMPA